MGNLAPDGHVDILAEMQNIYEELERLSKRLIIGCDGVLQVWECEKCGHPTVQRKGMHRVFHSMAESTNEGHWECLTCGTKWVTLKEAKTKVVALKDHDRVE